MKKSLSYGSAAKRSIRMPVASAGAVAAIAFLPGQAEAHCGHGMYNIQRWTDAEGWENWGCVGKGDTPSPEYECVYWSGSQCMEAYLYYNCYEPC
jgi:hypothetical protein